MDNVFTGKITREVKLILMSVIDILELVNDEELTIDDAEAYFFGNEYDCKAYTVIMDYDFAFWGSDGILRLTPQGNSLYVKYMDNLNE